LLWNLLHAAKGVEKFLHISTCSIRTNARTPFKEGDLDNGQQFVSPYDLTKYLAEQVAQKFYLDRPITIIRLGSVLATREGVFPHTNDWFFQTIRLWLCAGVNVLPLGENQQIQPIPVDALAECLCDLIAIKHLPHILHIPSISGPTMKEIFRQMSVATGCAEPRLFAQHETSWLEARGTMSPYARRLIDRLYPPPPPGQRLATMDSTASHQWMVENGLGMQEPPEDYWTRLAYSVHKQCFRGSEQ
jgi:nucleoside-diphosphate-sugar epimerase